MIEASYLKGDNPSHHHLLIRGHANAAPHGHDIVCAGVSAIAFALLGYLERHALCDTYPPEIEPGMMDIFCVSEDAGVAAAFETAVIGLEQLALHHPQNVEFKYFGDLADDTREKTPR